MDKQNHRNNSSQVNDLLHFDDDDVQSKTGHKEKREHDREQSSKAVCCTCTCTCPCCSSKHYRSGAASPGPAGRDKPMRSPSSSPPSRRSASPRHAERDRSKWSSSPERSSSPGPPSRRSVSPRHAERDRSKLSPSPERSSSPGPPSRRSVSPRHAERDRSKLSPSPERSRGRALGWGRDDEDEPMSTEKYDYTSSCCQLDDLKRLPQCHQRLGQLDFSRTHTVLIDVASFRCKAVIPQEGRDMWNSNFVKMPHSQASLMIKSGITKQQQVRRWDVISKHLGSLAKKTSVSVEDVEEAILKYNPKYKGQWKFDALSTFVKRVPKAENYFRSLFPKIAELALRLPEQVKKAIPLLQSGHSAVITLSQLQIACLLANAFFCTFPHRNTTSPKAEYHKYPSINFTSLFGNWSERKKEKLRAIMHYFKVVTDENAELKGLVTFERRCNTDKHNWESCKEMMPKLHVTSRGAIETEGTGMLQVDFACSWIGGGVLGSGLVQEEILFLINPELIVSRLFTEKLNDNECLIITGSQQFSRYSGFGDSFEWAGPHPDTLKRDEWERLQRQILAIDALNFKYRSEQYDKYKVKRELNKAYCGFKGHGSHEPDIATGKWGCGAFNGDPQLKALIQLMAAAKARRGLAFFTFGDDRLKESLEQMYHLLVREGVTVEKLYRLLEDFCTGQHSSHTELFDFIRKKIKRSRSRM